MNRTTSRCGPLREPAASRLRRYRSHAACVEGDACIALAGIGNSSLRGAQLEVLEERATCSECHVAEK